MITINNQAPPSFHSFCLMLSYWTHLFIHHLLLVDYFIYHCNPYLLRPFLYSRSFYYASHDFIQPSIIPFVVDLSFPTSINQTLPSFILSSDLIATLPSLSLTHFLTIPCRLGLKITSSNLREFLLPPPPSIPFFSPWAQYYNTSFKTQRIDRCHEWRTSDSCLKWYLRFDNSWALTQYCCSKWVFWIKCNPCASISQYKACLLKLDYHETFNLVINLTTIQIFPSITLSHRWEVHQLDINNTFLLEYPYEEVFISNYLASFVSLDPITFVVCTNLFIAWRHTSGLVHWV